MNDKTLDPSACRASVFTGTRGLFSPIAHDLELSAVPGTVEATSAGVRAVFSRAQVRVVGVVRGGATRTDVLSAKDVAEIEHRIDAELFAKSDRFEVDVTLDGERVRLTVRANGRAVELSATAVTRENPAGGQTTEGECVLSLKALGVGPIKGPLGVFQVSDEVRVKARAGWR